jgi:hypothetical protein
VRGAASLLRNLPSGILQASWVGESVSPDSDEELLAGKGVAYPRLLEVTFKKAPKARRAAEEQMALGGTEIDEPF